MMSVKKDVANSVSKGRMLYWRTKKSDLRRKVLRHQDSLKWQLRDRPDLWRELVDIKNYAVRSEWMKHQVDTKISFMWITEGEQSGGMDACLQKEVDIPSAKSDDFLIAKFGTVDEGVEPQVALLLYMDFRKIIRG